MKNLTTYITEKLQLKNVRKQVYNYHPENLEELCDILTELCKTRGMKGDFNDIDTSKITDMSSLFAHLSRFNGDISKWDVSNVENMDSMFFGCSVFNCDLSQWDVSNVYNMNLMFYNCYEFEGKGLENWKLDSIEYMEHTLAGCKKLDFQLDYWANYAGFDWDETLN